MYQRILVPVDGSETAKQGLAEAVRLAQALGSQVRLIHVVDDSALALNPETGIAAAPLVEHFAEGGKEILAEAHGLAASQGLEAEVTLHENFTGRVADVIVNEARNWPAQIIVMGTHGRQGLRRAVLGSDAQAVVQTSPVPVLLVRAPQREQSGA
jgi:nucleotide-binding universal stress UspA family protein